MTDLGFVHGPMAALARLARASRGLSNLLRTLAERRDSRRSAPPVPIHLTRFVRPSTTMGPASGSHVERVFASKQG